MASVDFRTGGFDGAYRRRVGDYGYDSKLDGHPDDAGYEQGEQDGLGGRLGKIVNYMGAVVSVTLVLGLGIWGYRLVTRDVSGVPVIRAMVGEARVAPADPGGELTRNTGLAVNAVPGGASVGKPADKVAIAPSTTGLTEEDLAMGEYGAVALVPGMLSEGTPLADANDPVIALQDSEVAARRARAEAEAAEAAALAAAAQREAAAALRADAPAAEAAVNGAVTSIDGEPADAGAISAALAEANATVQTAQEELSVAMPGALAASTRPASRPARRVAAVSPGAAAAAVPAAATPEAAPPQASVASGGSVVQLGAFDSDAIARSEWNRIAGRSGGLFSGKGQIVQRYERNGRVFYRLRVAGFESNSAAEAFCSALKAKGTDCLAMRVN